MVTPTTSNQIQATMKQIGTFISRMNNEIPSANRRIETYSASRAGQVLEPYCLFHKAGVPIYGTVLLFHGFSDRPIQQSKLASYLFHTGFNVYNVFLAGHYMTPGTQYWARTVYQTKVEQTVQANLAIPANAAALQAVLPDLQSGNITASDVAVLNQIVSPYSYQEIMQARQDPRLLGTFQDPLQRAEGHERSELLPEMNSGADSITQYIRDAETRLAELASMPGPVFINGLSIGGEVSLALTESDGGNRVRGVFAQSPCQLSGTSARPSTHRRCSPGR